MINKLLVFKQLLFVLANDYNCSGEIAATFGNTYDKAWFYLQGTKYHISISSDGEYILGHTGKGLVILFSHSYEKLFAEIFIGRDDNKSIHHSYQLKEKLALLGTDYDKAIAKNKTWTDMCQIKSRKTPPRISCTISVN